MRSELQTHKGRQFFFCNYANLETDALQAELAEVDAYVTQQPPGSVFILVDARGVTATRENIGLFIRSIQRTKKYLCKSAVMGVGFSGQRKVLFDAIMRIAGGDMTVFDDVEKAKDWLVEG